MHAISAETMPALMHRNLPLFFLAFDKVSARLVDGWFATAQQIAREYRSVVTISSIDSMLYGDWLVHTFGVDADTRYPLFFLYDMEGNRAKQAQPDYSGKSQLNLDEHTVRSMLDVVLSDQVEWQFTGSNKHFLKIKDVVLKMATAATRFPLRLVDKLKAVWFGTGQKHDTEL